jgi:hypothetical protein
MQSAALSLGSMHAQFGHIEEAMQALNETVGGGGQGKGRLADWVDGNHPDALHAAAAAAA